MVPPWIADAARRVGEALQARTVLLFGSYATGDASRRSDLDLLVISERVASEPPLRRIERALHALGAQPVAVDVLVLTPDELATRDHTPFMRRVLREAQVVYESR